MTELVTSGSVGGMASNGCLYPEVAAHLWLAVNSTLSDSINH
jgi:hypothetical protein